jgi:tetratricopeptide (TPR) repeat protein
MWTALGACYEALGRRSDAIACTERAAEAAEISGETASAGLGAALLKLARLYKAEEDGAAASKYYAQFLQSAAAGASAPAETSEALLHLASLAMQDGRLKAAETYALRVLSLPAGTEDRAARAMLAELRIKELKVEEQRLQEVDEGEMDLQDDNDDL